MPGEQTGVSTGVGVGVCFGGIVGGGGPGELNSYAPIEQLAYPAPGRT